MKDIKQFIDQTVADLKSNPDVSRFKHDIALAKLHPDNEITYFKDLKYKIHKELVDNPIGRTWTENNFNDPFMLLEKTGKTWIESYLEIIYKHFGQNSKENVDSGVLELGKSFLQTYFYIKAIDNYMNILNGKTDQVNNSKILSKPFDLAVGVAENEVKGYHRWLKKSGDIVCSEAEFCALFSNDQLPKGWRPLVFKNSPTALGALLLKLTDIKRRDKRKAQLKGFFVDENGDYIIPKLDLSSSNMERYLMTSKQKKDYIS